jgi:hypothetical protein
MYFLLLRPVAPCCAASAGEQRFGEGRTSPPPDILPNKRSGRNRILSSAPDRKTFTHNDTEARAAPP